MTTAAVRLQEEDFVTIWQGAVGPAHAAELLSRLLGEEVSVAQAMNHYWRFRAAGVNLKDPDDRDSYAHIPFFFPSELAELNEIAHASLS